MCLFTSIFQTLFHTCIRSVESESAVQLYQPARDTPDNPERHYILIIIIKKAYGNRSFLVEVSHGVY